MLTEQGPLVLEGSQIFDVKSAAVGDMLRVTVAPPLLYDAFRNQLPTVYILDANLCLPIASGIARTLQVVAFGSMPPVICVGIGYPTDAVLDVFSLRTRDLTPVEGEMPPSPLGKHGMGAADGLRDALTDEIFPLVEDRFRSDPADRTLVGWSFGGLFGLHTLFTRPEAFTRYLLISPSIWWADSAILGTESAYASAHEDLPAKVYACVGEREETAPSRMWPPVPEESAARRLHAFAMGARMVSNLDALVATLRSRRYPGLELTHEVFTDEHHTTVFPAAFTRGLVSLYAS